MRERDKERRKNSHTHTLNERGRAHGPCMEMMAQQVAVRGCNGGDVDEGRDVVGDRCRWLAGCSSRDERPWR